MYHKQAYKLCTDVTILPWDGNHYIFGKIMDGTHHKLWRTEAWLPSP